MTDILSVTGLALHFGGIHAVDEVSFTVREKEIAALIGPNGAGKTSVFNCVSGLYQPTHGIISVHRPGDKEPKVITRRTPDAITRSGIARTFQNIRLFGGMTALENVMIGMDGHMRGTIAGAVLGSPHVRREEKAVLEESYRLLVEIGIERYCNEAAKNLPYGAQRRLEIARALAAKPFLLLLDEPAAGMNPQETRELDDLILCIRERHGLAVLLIEHDMNLVMRLSERILVMDYGRIIAEGRPEEIRHNRGVIEAYLGEAADA
ncbi:MAG: ABC transporter ATP-binding protein [Spirochaetes bacterium]|nr:ABC transporter ATP-binding protein [Spirochaetota bacterium]